MLVPFKRPPMSASGGIPSAALVLIDLETEAGVTGRSYVFGFAPWTLKPIVGCLEGAGRDDQGRRSARPSSWTPSCAGR